MDNRKCQKCGSEDIVETFSGEVVMKEGKITTEITSPFLRCRKCGNEFFGDVK